MVKLPLDGLLVADFSRVLAGPLCTQMLADAGARVIKVEEPSRGDETRRWGPPFAGGESAYFLAINRNKESLALNLKSDAGSRAARQLIERADVVIENFLPVQRRALRFTHDEIAALNPRAIHCAISGFDSDTPDAETPGYDLLAQAGAGLMAITGEPDGDPMKIGVALSDVLTAHHAFGGITTALLRRVRDGVGAFVEVSLFSSTLASLVNVAQAALITGNEAQRLGNEHPSIVPYQLFHAADRPFAIGAGTDRHFRTLCESVVECAELAADSRFITNAMRVANREALLALLDARFRTAPADVWVARCRAVSIPVSLVQRPLEALRGAGGRVLLESVEHPAAGTISLVRNPIRIDGARYPIRLPPPRLGEQTESLLRELGCSEDDIARIGSENADGVATKH